VNEVRPHSVRMQSVDEIYALLRTAGTRKRPLTNNNSQLIGSLS